MVYVIKVYYKGVLSMAIPREGIDAANALAESYKPSNGYVCKIISMLDYNNGVR